jgi:hypothetical protein
MSQTTKHLNFANLSENLHKHLWDSGSSIAIAPFVAVTVACLPPLLPLPSLSLSSSPSPSLAHHPCCYCHRCTALTAVSPSTKLGNSMMREECADSNWKKVTVQEWKRGFVNSTKMDFMSC